MKAPFGRLRGSAAGGDESRGAASGIRKADLARASDRMIIAVALVIVAAVIAMGGFALVAAERIDTVARGRWGSVVLESLQRRASGLQRDLSSFAHWDESVLRTAYFLDVDWVHENFGRWLYKTRRHNRSYIVLDGGVAYASVDGELTPINEAPFDVDAIMPLVLGVQSAYVARAANADASATGEVRRTRDLPAVFRAGYMRVEGKPALVGAINITPDYGRVVPTASMPPIAVTVVFIDENFLGDIIGELHISDPRVSNDAPDPSRQAVAIPFYDPSLPPAWLSWLPENPGASLIRALLPALIGTAALLLAAAAIVLWYARRATQDLAASEALSSRLAYVDPLTGLANRAMLARSIGEWSACHSGTDRFAIFFLDLDGFKDINDTLGHHVGDQLLTEIGSRLNALPIPVALASRFGGDEFVILTPIGPDDQEVEAVGAVILAAIRQPVMVADQTLVVSGSIGATIVPDHGTEPTELLRLADIAVYRAKADGRNSVRLFAPSMERDVLHRRELERELRRALDEGELTVFYQPQFAASGEAVVGFEALVRWNHPTMGLISPGEFIPIAEQTGLVTELDMWVLRQACAQAKGWGNTKIAVNLSPVDFRMRDLAVQIGRILEEEGFPPERLEIEITENLLFGNHQEAFASLASLRAMGMRIALDDFGSGYSSLGYIRRFRVDTIKIDRSFTQNIGRSDDAAAIIDCVVRLARALAINVTAEGVETREQLRYLQSVGCNHVQGFLLASPVPLSSVDRYLELARRPVEPTPQRLHTFV
ncbi:putative bifunctional diguanylate cyclase/phosphodiesterase [Ancylobacter pratisalsi]|uniref:Bifunctional diguanylate cyclase/phosphodiesterase n=1 Tax=Ancylobacter pratisalsi TaxID=1745854 RepID=A0A6P1YHR4_9HYPH|nr:bifunctional diguanylate cyclase/phosphodiesterase [Ancylobacter pratisalsi]QIB32341.1 bifunctional diguanylate cyclase/phosphodiesterase [Ancylobacter pratisalsi]